jgi:hypothetical protein
MTGEGVKTLELTYGKGLNVNKIEGLELYFTHPDLIKACGHDKIPINITCSTNIR